MTTSPLWTCAGALGLTALAFPFGLTAPPQTADAAPPAESRGPVATVAVEPVAVEPVAVEPAADVKDPVADRPLAPVETDMHEFMEYVYQPTYRRLKASMAAEEKDRKAWSAVKSDALILAEAGNLTLMRGPQGEDRAAWNAHSVATRDAGGALYRAAKAKDESVAQQSYRTMIQHCNACHTQFADGEHMLTP
ncbi:cytochrome c [Alienimonas chondri]|uniref:Cytochrome c n=1 Tax=Alienimonas chondri TaxID=2681879 RepID=A0ABX1VGG2_9PLAN|nr:cytochrome c [Alienimonas chondri]NNJ27194.1 hypothetical protein [Alienimonas chondri]